MTQHVPYTSRPGLFLLGARSLSPARTMHLSRFRGFRFMGYPARVAYRLATA